MLENFTTFFKKVGKKEQVDKSKNAAKERLHLVLMQDRANVSADFLEMMKQEIVDVIKKYIDVDETDMDVKLENRVNNDGTSGAPALYANIPIVGINEEKKKESVEIGKAKQAELEEKGTEKEKKTKTAKKSISEKKSTPKADKSIKTDKDPKAEKVAKVTKASKTSKTATATKAVKDEKASKTEKLLKDSNTEKEIPRKRGRKPKTENIEQ